MVTLYSDYGCPFLHRVSALAHRLGIGYETRYVEHGQLPAELLALSPSGRIPLARVGDLTLYESTVICEYLVETTGWSGAYPRDAAGRAMHRLAIRQLDDVIMSSFVREARTQSPPSLRVDEALDQIEAAVTGHPLEGACLLSLSAGPLWLCWTFAWPESTLYAAICERRALRDFLDEASELPSIRATMPAIDRAMRSFAVAQASWRD